MEYNIKLTERELIIAEAALDTLRRKANFLIKVNRMSQEDFDDISNLLVKVRKSYPAVGLGYYNKIGEYKI